ncbi:MAG: mechanosensitive ion channel family protein [Peptococcaceae bacterium]|nr:mechanosensitive ion channel family protein [Peptococcaceae bacterium]MBO5301291.1 mechanosensitive ion channel family protein [Peptococcaceae bacterium]
MNENEAVGEVIEAITTQPDVVVVEALEAIRNLFLGSMGIFIKIGMVLLVMVIAKKLITTFIDNLFHNKLLTNASKNDALDLEEKRLHTLSKLFKSIATYVIYFIAIITCLDMVGFSVTTILAGAGVLSLAVAFGAQSIVEDLMSGIFIVLENQYSVGEYVQIDGIQGIVREIGMKTTKVQTYDGQLMIIKNGSIGTVINYSRSAQRGYVEVGIAYEENIQNAINVIEQACAVITAQYKAELDETPNVQGVTELADSSVVIRTTFTAWNWQQLVIERALRQAIKEELDKAGVEISYPKVQLVQ